MRPMTLFAFAAAAVLVLSGVAGAAGDPAHGGGHGEGEGGLSFLQIKRWDLGIFTLIVFGLLLLVLHRFAWPKITEGLAKREAVILGAREEALKARQDVEEVRAKLQKEYADAQDKIRALLDEARRDASALRASEKEAGARDAAAERERAKREIEAARDAALEDIYEQAVDLATTLSAKTLARKITADDHRALLAESLAELKQTAKS
ncbi:MAG: ATP synthase F0 subunit B [Gemmataceae bacterium]|nr:ATP synthase F0 subunit B [Gemmataceae bacterium]